MLTLGVIAGGAVWVGYAVAPPQSVSLASRFDALALPDDLDTWLAGREGAIVNGGVKVSRAAAQDQASGGAASAMARALLQIAGVCHGAGPLGQFAER